MQKTAMIRATNCFTIATSITEIPTDDLNHTGGLSVTDLIICQPFFAVHTVITRYSRTWTDHCEPRLATRTAEGFSAGFAEGDLRFSSLFYDMGGLAPSLC